MKTARFWKDAGTFSWPTLFRKAEIRVAIEFHYRAKYRGQQFLTVQIRVAIQYQPSDLLCFHNFAS